MDTGGVRMEAFRLCIFSIAYFLCIYHKTFLKFELFFGIVFSDSLRMTGHRMKSW